MRFVATSSVFLFVLLASPYFAQAQIYKSGNGCYEVRLAGSLIDVNECKQTAIRLRQVDCTTKANVKLDRVFATLSQCSADQARGQVPTPTGPINFLAKRNLQSGMEYWSIASAVGEGEPVNVQVAKAPVARRLPTRKAAPARRAEASGFSLQGPERAGLGLYADLARVFFSQDEFKRSGTANSNLLQSTRNLRATDTIRDSFSLGYLNARAMAGEGAFDFVIDISSGQLAEVLSATPTGRQILGDLFITQAFGSYTVSPRLKFKAGIFDGPLNIEDKRPGLNPIYGPSLTQTYGLPHTLTGIGAQFELFSIAMEVDAVNGWNRVSDDNSDLAFALTAKKSWSKWNSQLGIFFSPNEGTASDRMHGQLASGILDLQYLLNEKVDLEVSLGGGSYTPGDNVTPSTQWYSMVGRGTYKWSQRDDISLSLEIFETTGAPYFQRSGWASTFLGNAAWKRKFTPNFASHVVLQADMPFGAEGIGPEAAMDFKFLTAVSWSGLWGDQPASTLRTSAATPAAAPVLTPAIIPPPAAPETDLPAGVPIPPEASAPVDPTTAPAAVVTPLAPQEAP